MQPYLILTAIFILLATFGLLYSIYCITRKPHLYQPKISSIYVLFLIAIFFLLLLIEIYFYIVIDSLSTQIEAENLPTDMIQVNLNIIGILPNQNDMPRNVEPLIVASSSGVRY